jgi:hypothetical protein
MIPYIVRNVEIGSKSKKENRQHFLNAIDIVMDDCDRIRTSRPVNTMRRQTKNNPP